ncbi:MAG: hypothetical protein B7Z37_06695 [Verrucomicrobia bacterium 12-59-8]|nr:MAG: hypothetical protein B7Z37_06695 [Verrucomicrobia bacterium 12-59-8]
MKIKVILALVILVALSAVVNEHFRSKLSDLSSSEAVCEGGIDSSGVSKLDSQIEVQNLSNDYSRIIDVSSSCSCTIVNFRPVRLAPRQSLFIPVHINAPPSGGLVKANLIAVDNFFKKTVIPVVAWFEPKQGFEVLRGGRAPELTDDILKFTKTILCSNHRVGSLKLSSNASELMIEKKSFSVGGKFTRVECSFQASAMALAAYPVLKLDAYLDPDEKSNWEVRLTEILKRPIFAEPSQLFLATASGQRATATCVVHAENDDILTCSCNDAKLSAEVVRQTSNDWLLTVTAATDVSPGLHHSQILIYGQPGKSQNKLVVECHYLGH